MSRRELLYTLALLLAVGGCQAERDQEAAVPASQPASPDTSVQIRDSLRPVAAQDTVVADTIVRDTIVTDTTLADTSSAHTAADTTVADTTVADTIRADTASADTAITKTTVPDTVFAGTTHPIRRAGPSAPPVAVLREVRAAAHPGYDRVVFEFAAGPLPGYEVAYSDGAIYACGSGDEVSVAGTSRLVVRLQPAQAHDDSGNATIKERQRALALPILKELRITCDFEAQVEWALGLAAKTPYRVLELGEPSRLVLDLKRGS